MKNLILQQPKKEAVEGLISSVLFGYFELENLINNPMEDYEIKKGLLKANLGVALTLNMELEELIQKSFTLKSKVGIITPRTVVIEETFTGHIPGRSQIDAHQKKALKEFEKMRNETTSRFDENEKEVMENISFVKKTLKDLKDDAKDGNMGLVEHAIRSLSSVSSWKTKICLWSIQETAQALIELAGQVGYYTDGTGEIIDKLEEALVAIKVRYIWFTFNKKSYFKPWADFYSADGVFEGEVSDEFIAKEFVINFKKRK